VKDKAVWAYISYSKVGISTSVSVYLGTTIKKIKSPTTGKQATKTVFFGSQDI